MILLFFGAREILLFYKELPESKVLDFLKTRNVKLFYLPPSFSEKALGPGWEWDNYNDNYSAEKSAFPIFGNTGTFRKSSDGKISEAFPGYFVSKMELTQDDFNHIERS